MAPAAAAPSWATVNSALVLTRTPTAVTDFHSELDQAEGEVGGLLPQGVVRQVGPLTVPEGAARDPVAVPEAAMRASAAIVVLVAPASAVITFDGTSRS